MKNRISFSPTEDFKTTYLAHLDGLILMGTTMITGTNKDDMKGGQTMGKIGGLNFAKDAVVMSRIHPRLIEDDNSSLAEFEADVNLIIFLFEVLERLEIIKGQVNQAYILVSKDLMEQANWVLAELKKRKDDPVFGVLHERLNVLYQKRADQAAKTVTNKANAQVQLEAAEAKVALAEAKLALAEARTVAAEAKLIASAQKA